MTATVQHHLGQAQRRDEGVTQALDLLATTRDKVDRAAAELAEAQRAAGSRLDTFGLQLADLRGHVYGTKLLVIKEKESTRFPEHGLLFVMSTLRVGVLRDFRVENIQTGRVLWGPRHLPMGDPIAFEKDTLSYPGTPRWFLEYGAGKDAAGIDLQWSRRSNPAVAAADAIRPPP